MKNLRLINFLKKWEGSSFISLKKFLKIYIILFLSCFLVQIQATNKQLIEAVQKNDIEQARTLLERRKASANAKLDGKRVNVIMISPSAEMSQLLLDYGANPNWPETMVNAPALHGAIDLEQKEILIKGGADPNIFHQATTPIMWSKSIEEAELYLNAGADPLYPGPTEELYPRWTALHQNKYVRQALAVSKKDDDVSFCEYVAEAQQVTSTRCGQRNLCMAEVVCVFRIGPTPAASLSIMNVELDVNFKPRNYKPKKYSYISRAYPVVCSALANGDCPPANECLLDRTFLQAETKTDDPPASSSPQSKTSKTGGMR